MPSHLKIGFITDNYPDCLDGFPGIPGGVGMYSKLVGEGLAKSGHEVHVFTPANVQRHRTVIHNGVYVWLCPPWGKRREMGIRSAIEFTLQHRRDSMLLGAYTIAVGARRAARTRPFDVIEAPNIGLLGKLSRSEKYCKRYAVRLHAGTAFFGRMPGTTRVITRMDELQREDTQNADVITAPTEYARHGVESFLGIKLPNAKIVGNPVKMVNGTAIHRDYSIPREGPSALFFGRLIYQKGIDVIASAIRPIRNDHPGFSVTFVGPDLPWHDGSSAADVIANHAQEKEAYRIFPSMNHYELLTLSQRCAIGLFPSREETFGMALVEAMAWGLPCVITDIPAYREIAEDGVQCLFCRPEDPEHLAYQANRLIVDIQLRQRIGLAAAKRASNWSVPNICSQLLAAWNVDSN